MKQEFTYKMQYILHNRVYCAKLSKFSWTAVTVQEYVIKHSLIYCMYSENMPDTAYVQGCNIKLQHKTNLAIFAQKKILWKLSEIFEIPC